MAGKWLDLELPNMLKSCRAGKAGLRLVAEKNRGARSEKMRKNKMKSSSTHVAPP